MSKTIKVTRSSGNGFANLCLPNANDRLKDSPPTAARATAYNAVLQLSKMAIAYAGYRVTSGSGIIRWPRTTLPAVILIADTAPSPFETRVLSGCTWSRCLRMNRSCI